MNPLYSQFGFNPTNFLGQLNALKSRGGDPNMMIQQMLNSGQITQQQYNSAVQRAQQIMSMLTPSAHR